MIYKYLFSIHSVIISNIISLNESLLKRIYSYLKLHDKFTFSLANKKFHCIFYNYPLLNTLYEIDHYNGYHKGKFLFKNIVNLRVKSVRIDNSYLSMFKNLREVNLSQMEFDSFGKVKALVYHLPEGLRSIIVLNDTVKELFKLGAHVHKRTFSV